VFVTAVHSFLRCVILVVCYRCFGTTFRSHLQGSGSPSHSFWTAWPLKMVPRG